MSKKPEIRAMPGGAVRISIPASVASDLGSFQKSMAIIAERIGCRTCFSGADCTFQIERDFLINEKLEINPAVVFGYGVPWRGPGVPWRGPRPEPWRGVTARLRAGVSYNLEKVQGSVAKIAGLLGCPTCCSGFDIRFLQELDFMVDENLNVQTVGRSF